MNFSWLRRLMISLNAEYIHRYNKQNNHASIDKILDYINFELDIEWECEGLTPFAQAMPDIYKCENVVRAYRSYYVNQKAGLLKYTNRNQPWWLTEESYKHKG